MIRLTVLLIVGLFTAMFLADNLPEPTPVAVQESQPLVVPEISEPILLPELDIPTLQPTSTKLVKFSEPVVVVSNGKVQSPDAAVVVEAVEPVEPEIVLASLRVEDLQRDVRYVAGQRVNVREGPSTQYNVVNQVLFADVVEIVGTAPDGWVEIRIEGDGGQGYMAARFLQPTSPLE